MYILFVINYQKLMKNKGFTLIELLVVVAIIGILAGVGVVTFSGFIEGAKQNATKSNHNIYVKFITAQLLKCALQDNKGYFEVKSDQFQQTVNNVSCNPNQTSTEDLRLIYVYHFENEGYRSPYNSKQTQLHPDTGIRGNFGTPNEGFSHITKSSDYKNLIITTSYKTGEQPLVSIIRDPRI
jgi:prepilin-type N-terminal cleavage/methylation domain-containing protein